MIFFFFVKHIFTDINIYIFLSIFTRFFCIVKVHSKCSLLVPNIK